MIQIYLPNNIDYEHNGDAVLEPISCECEMTLNAEWHLELEYPVDEEKFKMIIREAVLSVPTPIGERQLFRIYETEKNDDSVTAFAFPIFFDSKDDHILLDLRPTAKNGQEALDIMCAGSRYTGTSDITAASTAYYIRTNLMEAINGDIDQSFINRWGGEILYDNYQIIINSHAGGDYGVRAEFGYNLEGIEEHVDMSSVVTRIIPVSYNGHTLEGDAPWVDSDRIDSYAKIYTKEIYYPDVKMKEDAGEDEEGCSTLEELREKLVQKCRKQFSQGIDLPKISYSVDMVSLEGTEEYKGYEILERVGLGDTVSCKHRILGIETKARAVSIKYDCIERRNKEIVLGDFQNTTFDTAFETQKAVESVIDMKSKTVMGEKVRGIIDAMNAKLRLQSTVAKKVNGRAFEISDLDPESELYGCMIFGSQGLQIATERTADGRDWNWRTAITAKGILADAIITGLLADKTGRNFWNLDTGEFRMSMESFTVDGKSIQNIADGAADKAAKNEVNDFINDTYGPMVNNLQNQIDGQVETFYFDYEPSLQNYPASDWDSTEERQKHEGDLFYWKSKGYAYRFFKDGATWKWQLVQDTDITQALAAAEKAQDTADGKRRIFVVQPQPPYDIGDLWTQGAGGDIIRCRTARGNGNFSAADWERASKYTDDTAINNFISGEYAQMVENIRNSIDGKAETWYQATDPSLAWKGTKENPLLDHNTNPILDETGNPLVTIWEEEKYIHSGDLWHNTTDNTEWIYQDGHWEPMSVPDELFDMVDGKAQIFISQPVPPYDTGDLWFTGTSIMVCITARISGVFSASDWNKRDNYTDDTALENFIAGDYAKTLEEVQTQIDGKAETWKQSADPSTAWKTSEERALHKGDLWYNTSDQKSYIYSGSLWELMKAAPPDSVFDEIDGKASIYVSQPKTPYHIGDLWLSSSTADILTCINERLEGNFTSSDWQKRNKYTDDSKAKEVEEALTALGEDLYTQIDGKIETWYQSTDPSAAWTQTVQKQEHAGDLWYNTSLKITKRWSGSGWVELENAKANAAETLAQSKKRIFGSQPTTPYDVNDIWVQGGNGDIMKCQTARATGNFISSDWIKASKYTDDSAVNNFVNNIYKAEMETLHGQIDGKAETWYQATDPALNWTGTEENLLADSNGNPILDESGNQIITIWEKEKCIHEGDLWHNTTNNTGWIYRNAAWCAMNIPDEVLDKIDGKAQIFTTQPRPPYDVGDLWTQGADGDIMRCCVSRSNGEYVASDWEKASKYTESCYYYLEADVSFFETKRVNGDIFPNTFTLRAYMQMNENPPKRVAYSGKLYVYGITSAGNDIVIYKTGTGIAESTKQISTYQLGSFAQVRCELWSAVDANGYIHKLNTLFIPVGRNPLSLNWKETFDMLTNNGRIQGLFAENGNIYINASYIRSGELVLGGLNNQYGTFRLKDEKDNEIGIWDRQGMTLTKSNGDYRLNINTLFDDVLGKVISIEEKINGKYESIADINASGTISSNNPTTSYGCSMSGGILNFTYKSGAVNPSVAYINGYRSGNSNALAIQSFGILGLISQSIVVRNTTTGQSYQGGSGTIDVVTEDASGKQWVDTLKFVNGIMVTGLS